MSGGSFNYALYKADSTEIFQGLEDYKAIEQFLRDNGKQEAANEVQKFILTLETAFNRLMVHGEYVKPLLRAAEWWASGDSGADGVDYAMGMLTGEESED
jgi:hypothetical protein